MVSQVDDPIASCGPLIPSLYKQAEKYCITCGNSDSVELCSRCKGVWYCNKKCQKADWSCHKLLCSKYAKVNEIEPLEDGYRVFLFRFDSLEPEIVIVPSSQHRSFADVLTDLLRQPGDDTRGPLLDSIDIRPLLDDINTRFPVLDGSGIRCPLLDGIDFQFNSRLRRLNIGNHRIEVDVRDDFLGDGSKPNKSILTCLHANGVRHPPKLWAGHVVVRRIDPMCASVTMADFRHTIDWLTEHPRHSLFKDKPQPLSPVPELDRLFQQLNQKPWSFDDIKGIMIMGDQRIKDESERYKIAAVPGRHPIRGLEAELQGDISPISKRVGLPLRIIMRPTQLRDLDADGRLPTCSPAMDLMRSLDKDTDVAQPQIAFKLPRGGLPYVDEALVVRADDKDLSLEDVKAMVFFSKSTCREVLQGVADTSKNDKPRMEAAMQRALDFMTWDNYLLAFDELGMPRPQRPAEEAFVDKRGSGLPNDVNDV